VIRKSKLGTELFKNDVDLNSEAQSLFPPEADLKTLPGRNFGGFFYGYSRKKADLGA